MKILRFHTIFLFIIVLFSVESGFAQNPKREADSLEVYVPEEMKMLETVVITATRTPKLLKDVPVVTRVIEARDIKNVDVANVQDLLQTELPGIEFTYSMNQQVSLSMQGFDGNSVLFLIDGERMAGETLDNVDYSRLGLDDVERIEIVKGAASSLYGSNAVGGVVNVISRQLDEPWLLNINARYGTHNDQHYGGTIGFQKGHFENTLNAQYVSCDAIKLPNDGDYGTIYAHQSLNARERLTYSYNGLKLTGRAGYFFRERESQQTSHDRYRDFSGGLKGEYEFSDKDDIMMSYAFDQYDKSNYSLTSHKDVRSYSNVQNSLRTLYNHCFTKKTTLTVGDDFMHDYLMTYQFLNNGSHEQNTADAFAQFDWAVTGKFNVLAALRYDYYSLSDLSHLSPKLSLMYKLKRLSIRASYADGFRAPTLKEMFMSFDMANIFMIYGNPNLKPESSNNLNVAAEYTRNSYNITVMGFYNMVNNSITTVWNAALNGMVYENMSPLAISGVDCSASANWDFGFKVRLSYVYTNVNYHENELHLSSTRPHSATARFEYGKRWHNYGFNLALTGRILSSVTCDEYTSLTDLTETQRVTYPGYTIWKLTLLQHVWRGLDISATVDNIFNYVPDYYYSNSPATTGTSFYVGLSVAVDKIFSSQDIPESP